MNQECNTEVRQNANKFSPIESEGMKSNCNRKSRLKNNVKMDFKQWLRIWPD
jgi:hypothetical protein